MLGILIKKEITETVLDFRFVIVTLLCVVIIPLGMYVSRKDYEQRLVNYQREHQMYRQHYGKNVFSNVQAQGFRPPSMLSMFALGLDPFMPDKAVTSRSGLFRAAKEPGIDNPQSLLFGKADFLFNVSFIVSLAALIFTFNSISSEKEKGTLRLTIANSVPRGQILIAKIVGNYVVILIPFLISLLFAVLILDASPNVSIVSLQVWPFLLVIIFVTFLFLLAMVSLGVCVSALTHGSVASIMLAFFVWVIAVLGIPKISPMIAESVYPIESRSVANLTQRIAREDIEEEYDQKKGELYEKKCRRELGLDPRNISPPRNEAERKAYAKYDQEAAALDLERQRRIANRIRQLEQDYRNKRDVQAALAMNLSRISPVSCYTYLIAELSGTGLSEPERFVKNAQRYQEAVREAVYDKYITKRYANTTGGSAASTHYAEGFDPSKTSLPEMYYQHQTLAEALQTGWADILLLFLFNILFFIVAFLRFRKYDVR